MAVLALGVVGSAIGGAIGGTVLGVSAAAIGGFIGAQVGGLIDNMLFAGTQNVEGPRLKDLSVTSSAYGSPIPLFYGPQNRAGGNVIWSSGLIETKHTQQSSGGKGGGGDSVTQSSYTYRVSVAVGLGDGRSAVFGTWPRLKRIWANGKVIFSLDAAGSAPAAPNADVGMVATKANGTHAVFNTLRFYQGTGTQQIDPTIEAFEGTDNTPAYRHTMYAVITDLQLADFGNVLPNMEFEIEADESIRDGAIVRDMCNRAGEALVSASSLSTDRLGFIVSRPGTVTSAIEPLALVGGFDAADQRGQIRFVRRGHSIIGTITRDEMGAVQAEGGERPEPIRFERVDDLPLPREAYVSYKDPALDHQVNTQMAARAFGSSENNLQHEVSVTMSADEARGIADRLLWEAWSGRRSGAFSTSDRWARRSAGDIVGLPVAGAVVPFKLSRINRGANGVVQFEARFEDPEIYLSNSEGAAGNLPVNVLELPGETELVLMDAPMLRAQDDDEGFYWAVSGVSPGWRGVELLRSADNGNSYTAIAVFNIRAAIGQAAVALPSGPAAFWDRGNTLQVELFFDEGEVESLDELAVLSGRNAAWLGPASGQGGEVIQFASATLVAENTYELADLLRGRLGTEHAIAGHGADELFVLLDSGSLRRSNFGAGDWNRERLFKPVSVLLDAADTDAQAFTNTGEGKRPLPVVHLRGGRKTVVGSPPAATDDVTITWFRRSRFFAPGMGYGPLPLGEQNELYEVDVLAGSPPAVVNTYQVTEPLFFYTEAQQTADGLTPGQPVTVRVFQLSAQRGRSRAAQATI